MKGTSITWMQAARFAPVLLALVLPVSARAQSAAAVCGTLLMSDEKTRCLATVAGHQVEPGAAALCRGALMGDEKIECLRGALDKRYSADELAACGAILMGRDKARCMAAAGQRPPPPPVPDDTGDRPRNRRYVDDEGDRPHRRRRGDDDLRIRFTNYHRATLSRLYWRPLRHGRLREVRLDSHLRTNEYIDLWLPDAVIQLCVESRDGFQLWWPELRVIDLPDQAMAIGAGEANWARGRCTDDGER
jgi:hypothetical protein